MADDNDKANRNTLRVCGPVGLCCKSVNICWALTRWPDKHKYYFPLHFHWFVTHLATGWHLINFCFSLKAKQKHIQPESTINQSNSQTHGASLCHGSVAKTPQNRCQRQWKMGNWSTCNEPVTMFATNPFPYSSFTFATTLVPPLGCVFVNLFSST